jgi:hypothetical protein
MRLAKFITNFGVPVTPSFENETELRVEYESEKKIAYDSFGRSVTLYRCKYCVADSTITHDDATWHPGNLMQIDHIRPFATIKNTRQYDHLIVELKRYGIAPIDAVHIDWGDFQQVQIIYNDLDNLQLVCTGHNQHKRANGKYHQERIMSIANLVLHKKH